MCEPYSMRHLCVLARTVRKNIKKSKNKTKKRNKTKRKWNRWLKKSEIERLKHRSLCLSYPLLIGVSNFNPMTSSPLNPPSHPHPHLLPSHPEPFISPSQHPSALHSIPMQTLLSAAGTKRRWIMAAKCHRFFVGAASSPRSPPGPSPKLTIKPAGRAPECRTMDRKREG